MSELTGAWCDLQVLKPIEVTYVNERAIVHEQDIDDGSGFGFAGAAGFAYSQGWFDWSNSSYEMEGDKVDHQPDDRPSDNERGCCACHATNDTTCDEANSVNSESGEARHLKMLSCGDESRCIEDRGHEHTSHYQIARGHRMARRETGQTTFLWEKLTMLQLAITCLVIALIAFVLGFGGIAGSFIGVAKILFIVFLVLAVLSFLGGRA